MKSNNKANKQNNRSTDAEYKSAARGVWRLIYFDIYCVHTMEIRYYLRQNLDNFEWSWMWEPWNKEVFLLTLIYHFKVHFRFSVRNLNPFKWLKFCAFFPALPLNWCQKILLMLHQFWVWLGIGMVMPGNKPLPESVSTESKIQYDLGNWVTIKSSEKDYIGVGHLQKSITALVKH